MTSAKAPVVFIHGLWLHATSWKPWQDLFTERGYESFAPGWLTAEEFHYSFGNALPEQESDDLYQRWAIPGPAKPLFETAGCHAERAAGFAARMCLGRLARSPAINSMTRRAVSMSIGMVQPPVTECSRPRPNGPTQAMR
jgi:hypothetical protein